MHASTCPSDRRRVRVALAALAASLLLASGAPAEDAAPPPDQAEIHDGPVEYVIAPGQEDLLAAMLGKGAPLVEGCSLSSGNIQHKVVLATYACPGGDVVFAVGHPSQAPSGATKTDRFAVALQSGTPPAGLQDALVTRIKEREGELRWTVLGGTADDTSWPTIAVSIATAVLVLGFFAWMLRARARRAAS